MKTYEPRRNNECPNGIHATYDPALDPTQNECTCPWLVIASSTPVQHLTSWSRRELENVIRETDRGYFDPPGYPLRSNSMFLSPNMQRLVDMAEKEPVAAALTLLAGAAAHGDSGLPPFDAIAWDAEDACLSLRSGAQGWRRLWLGHANVDTVTDHSKTPGGVAPVLLWAEHVDTYDEIGLPRVSAERYPEPAQDYFAEDDCTCDLNTREQCDGCKAIAVDLADAEEDVTSWHVNFPHERCLTPQLHIAHLWGEPKRFCNAQPQTPTPIFAETAAAVDALPRRVPQVPSAIAEAAFIDSSRCFVCGNEFTASEILGDMTTHGCATPVRHTPDVID